MAGTTPFGRMPPVGSNVRNSAAEALITQWINEELALYAPYETWRSLQVVDPGGPDEDPDGDGAVNELERITRTDPNDGNEAWNHTFMIDGDTADISYLHLSGLDFRIESSTNLTEWTDWEPAPYFYPAQTSATNDLLRLDLMANPRRFFRFRITEP